MRNWLVFGLLCLIGTTAAHAANPVVASVTDAGTNADGSIFVVFDRSVVMCGTKGVNRIDLANDHPAKNQVLLIAMTALAAFGSTKTYVPTCNKDKVPQFEPGEATFQLTAEKPVPIKK